MGNLNLPHILFVYLYILLTFAIKWNGYDYICNLINATTIYNCMWTFSTNWNCKEYIKRESYVNANDKMKIYGKPVG